MSNQAGDNRLAGSIDINGFSIPKNKRIEIALRSIYGVGKHNSQLMIEDLKLDPDMRMGLLDHDIIHSIREYVKNKEAEGVMGNAAKHNRARSILNLQAINCYRGRRSRLNLPRRGQNTKSNHKRSKWRTKNNNKKR
ncbi:MAG: 30S ribosomal protein S13 [Pseudomonadota bacterium]